jgi:hypothetical protein
MGKLIVAGAIIGTSIAIWIDHKRSQPYRRRRLVDFGAGMCESVLST